MHSLDSVLSLAAGKALKHRVDRDHGAFALSPAYCRQVARWYDSAPMDGIDRNGVLDDQRARARGRRLGHQA